MTEDKIKAEDYVSYVDSVTYKLCKSFGCVNDFDDLRSCGYLGLLEAIDRFDSEKNVKFKQFAYIRISGAIVDGMRSLYAGSKKSVTFKRKLEEIQSRLGTDASDELAAELGMTLEEFHKNKNELNKMCRANFTDLFPVTTEGSDVVDILGEFTLVEPGGDFRLTMDEVWDFIEKNYSKRDLTMMELLYKKEMTMLQTGKLVDLTECRVSQIHRKIVSDIRRRLFKLPETVNAVKK
jgi:RNA polymerase sigma factor for flagellar operon FliA